MHPCPRDPSIQGSLGGLAASSLLDKEGPQSNLVILCLLNRLTFLPWSPSLHVLLARNLLPDHLLKPHSIHISHQPFQSTKLLILWPVNSSLPHSGLNNQNLLLALHPPHTTSQLGLISTLQADRALAAQYHSIKTFWQDHCLRSVPTLSPILLSAIPPPDLNSLWPEMEGIFSSSTYHTGPWNQSSLLFG